MTWWGWLVLGVLIGSSVTVLVAHEVAVWGRAKPRAITIDLVGAKPTDADDWFAA